MAGAGEEGEAVAGREEEQAGMQNQPSKRSKAVEQLSRATQASSSTKLPLMAVESLLKNSVTQLALVGYSSSMMRPLH